jgi:Ca-activated chloride channel family protein
MQFIWSDMLALLALVPLFVVIYIWVLRRRVRYALRYSSLYVVHQAMDHKRRIRRHIPPLFFLLGLIAMLLAFARPYTEVSIPKRAATVILTIDTSASMSTHDIKPSRIAAAKAAARAFVLRQDPMPRIGIVAFSESANLVQAPTLDRQAVLAAIDRLDVDTTTAIGSGILVSLEAILHDGTSGSSGMLAAAPALPPTPLPPGQHAPASIVLLTDGQNVVGPSPIDAAQTAAQYGVRVFTIGIGTTKNQGLAQGSPFGDDLDEVTLQRIAQITDAKYFRASDESALADIYRNLDPQIVFIKQKQELTIAFTAAAILLNVIGGMFSMLTSGVLP